MIVYYGVFVACGKDLGAEVSQAQVACSPGRSSWLGYSLHDGFHHYYNHHDGRSVDHLGGHLPAVWPVDKFRNLAYALWVAFARITDFCVESWTSHDFERILPTLWSVFATYQTNPAYH